MIYWVIGEIDVKVCLDLDGFGQCQVSIGVLFFDYMFYQISSYGLIDLEINVVGDIYIDDYYINEDVGIVVGQVLVQVLGDWCGIYCFGYFVVLLDEVLVQVVLDCFGCFYLSYSLVIISQKIGMYDIELVKEFFVVVVNNSGLIFYICQLDGVNFYYIVEVCFKVFV